MRKTKIAHIWARKAIALFILFSLWKSAACQSIDTLKLNKLFDYLAKNNQAMGSLAILQSGQIVYQRTLGYRVIANDRAISANVNTKYRIWSITKMYTATMILQMEEEGKITLETTLDKFFPSIANAKEITIRQMLNHRSGIHDFTDAGDDTLSIPAGRSQKDMIMKISHFKADFSPGEKFQYSNSNYLLLGYIIEKLDHLSFSIALKNRITSRIGLSNTYYGKEVLDTVENKSLSYRFEAGKWTAVDERDFSGLVPGAAGSIVSTPGDMVRFVEALFTGKLISKGQLEKMTDISDFYGLGIFAMPNQWSKGFGHGGGYIASHATLVYYPKDSLAIAYCTNGHVYGMDKILTHVSNICFDKSYQLPFSRATVNVNDAILKMYAGIYETAKFRLMVEQENDHLMITPAGQPPSAFYACSETRFFSKDINVEIEFIFGINNTIVGLLIFQGDRKMEGKKIR